MPETRALNRPKPLMIQGIAPPWEGGAAVLDKGMGGPRVRRLVRDAPPVRPLGGSASARANLLLAHPPPLFAPKFSYDVSTQYHIVPL